MDSLREQARNGASLDDLLPETFAVVREAGKRTMGMRHFDVQLIGGMVLHGGNIAEMKTGEGKTLTATLAVVLNSLPGKGVHVVTVNDYLARRDAEWMSPIYEALGVSRRRAAEHAELRGQARRVRLRRHVRDELRVRLRLPARQHGDGDRGEGPARPPVRRRRRGRQHPHRRGAHAADHLRRAGAGGRALPPVRQARADDGGGQAPRGPRPEVQEGVRRRLRLRVRREAQDRRGDRARRREGREVHEGRPPVPGRERPHGQPPAAVAEGRVAVQARRRLRRDRRRGPHHRRVHRPHPRGPALVGGPAPGRRGQGGRARPGGEPDPRDDHAAELLPDVRQALRHDRHRPHRGDRVHEDLQARRRPGPDEPPDGARRPERPGLQDQGRQVARGAVARSRSATSAASRSSSARSRSRSPSCSASSSRRRASSTRSSTPSPSTPSARARSSPRRASPARSRSRRTWPAAASTSSSAATPST